MKTSLRYSKAKFIRPIEGILNSAGAAFLRRMGRNMLATTRFTPQLIEHIQEQGLVLLSPNLDDVAYSIGHLVEQVGTGLLINVFNSPGHATKSSTSLPQTATGQEVNGRESA